MVPQIFNGGFYMLERYDGTKKDRDDKIKRSRADRGLKHKDTILKEIPTYKDGKVVMEKIHFVSYKPSYSELREAAYPSIEDQLDALWKGGDALEKMKATIESVKLKYPKV